MWGDVHRLFANTTSFYIRDLSICRFWYPWGFLEPTGKDDGSELIILGKKTHPSKGIFSSLCST